MMICWFADIDLNDNGKNLKSSWSRCSVHHRYNAPPSLIILIIIKVINDDDHHLLLVNSGLWCRMWIILWKIDLVSSTQHVFVGTERERETPLNQVLGPVLSRFVILLSSRLEVGWCKLCFWNASCTQVIAGYPNALPETFHTTNKCPNAYPAIGPVLHRVQHCNARHWKMRCTGVIVGVIHPFPLQLSNTRPSLSKHQIVQFTSWWIFG